MLHLCFEQVDGIQILKHYIHFQKAEIELLCAKDKKTDSKIDYNLVHRNEQ